ncbi:DUF1441 family protein [Escherichia coli]|nr:DUF1441 family protein [Escherichia coli]EFH8642346.1 DUF1441 family protein [Escherichia coli]
MSNVSGIGDAYYWSVFKIAEAFGLHRDTVKKRLLAANTPMAATVRGNPVYALQHVGPALFSVKHEAADSVHDPSRIAEPRLDDNSQTTFYLAASKGSDTIEVAYLNGVDKTQCLIPFPGWQRVWMLSRLERWERQPRLMMSI